MKAPEILDKAAGHMRDRAATYDKPDGERSMGKAVNVFNAFHGTALTEAQGWHFMQILKDVRLFTRDGYHADSGEDGVAYAALKCEAMAILSKYNVDEIAEKAKEIQEAMCPSIPDWIKPAEYVAPYDAPSLKPGDLLECVTQHYAEPTAGGTPLCASVARRSTFVGPLDDIGGIEVNFCGMYIRSLREFWKRV